MAEPYAGLRVLDFTSGIAGAMATGLLAQFGGDVVRVAPASAGQRDTEPVYLAWNCNKRRLELDLEDSAGLATAKDLIATADVAVFDHAPGQLERLGLDGNSLTAKHARLVHAWLPMYGAEGRWRDLPPSDALLSAVTGIAFAQSSYEDVPVQLVTPQVAYGHGILAAGAVAAALFERLRTGQGQAVLCTGVHAAGAVRSGGAIRAEGMQRLGAGRGARGGSPNYRLYQCRDGRWLFLATLTQPFFLRGLEAMDLLELLAMEGVEGDIANLQKPPTNLEVIARLDERFAEKDCDEWLEIFRERGVPAGPVGARDEWFAGEQVAANEMRVEFRHPELGHVAVPGVSAKLMRTPGSVRELMRGTTLAEVKEHSATQATAQTAPATKPPLHGIRVLDLGNVIAGPFGPTVLASYGADVIKVEPPDGDSFRMAAIGFAGWNRGKRSIVLDVKTEAGKAAFFELVRTSDVVVDNFRLGVCERLGIDYATLAAINPRIITCSVLGFGKTGPFAAEPGFDPILQARSGLMAAQGGDDEPVFHTIAVNDEASALMSAFACTVALYERERSGMGQEVWTALANQAIVTQSGQVTWYEGRPPAPRGGRDCSGISAAHRVYECADGWLAVACETIEHARSFVRAFGDRTPWTASDFFQEEVNGVLAQAMAATLKGLSVEEVAGRLAKNGVPVAPAIRIEESYEDEWLNANGFWEEYELPGHGQVLGVAGYAQFSRTPSRFTRPAPALNAHHDEIMAELR
jgi:crotonobetainyl-CoA:carnitine CoA-transferase CaiB-like acyl-CoA transferase